ncbi:haloacid dehalogenase [Acinetobacter sp. TGL-Y2]|uniref:HAD family hydrolase n=1 Tax=Acinetobacter sp. TGL-Y2 TaxID=1407071 RepID=UPI0007A67D34|nr:HAD-IA family hydrolase [Acinetobacter sp. TGL-Y2]AMW77976.1 haloacid dehalogenase [Acinetobacter sp. TGL-Y2]
MTKNKDIHAVIFDLDQTLLDRESSLEKFLDWQINFFQIVPQQKKKAFINRFMKLDCHGSVWKDSVYTQLIKEFSLTQSVDTLLRSYIEDFNQFATAFEGVELAIKTLYQQGYRLGLISNGRSPFQENNFKALGLNEFFSSVLVSEAIGIRKPDPEIFNRSCLQLNTAPEHCVFIGDNEIADIQGAHKAGMKTIYFNQNPNKRSQLSNENLHYFKDLDLIISNL